MAFGKNVGLKGMQYRGGGPMLAWLLHRISGLGMIILVSMHVLASFFTYVVATGSDFVVKVNDIYEAWPFQLFIYFCVMFHALNGLRIILMDLWPQFLKYQREAIWLEWGIFLPTYGFILYFTLQKVL
jgi:succinate dehydrogenase / fumarate reductase cytochrome b subunit